MASLSPEAKADAVSSIRLIMSFTTASLVSLVSPHEVNANVERRISRILDSLFFIICIWINLGVFLTSYSS